MSRSYRKPWVTHGYGTRSRRYAKREANHKVRRARNIPDGKGYRRVYDPWNIRDWSYYWYRSKYEPYWRVGRK